MTCVIGYLSKGNCYMGADSLVSNSSYKEVIKEPKCFYKGDILFGLSGSVKVLNLIKRACEFPSLNDPCFAGVLNKKLYYIQHVVPSVIEKCLTEFNKNEVINGESSMDSVLLMIFDGKLYTLYNNYSVLEQTLPYEAVGSGCSLAMGAMAILEDVAPKLSPEKKIYKAITTAANRCPSVGGHVNILRLKNNKLDIVTVEDNGKTLVRKPLEIL